MRAVIALCCAFSIGAAQQPPAQNASYVGAFADGPADYVVVGTVGGGKQQMLLLAETRNEQLRILFPAGRDSFQTGSSLARPTPVENRVVFRRANGRAALEMTSATSGRTRVFPAISIDRRDVAFANASVTLRGTLYSPSGADIRLPVIVLANGSEASDRNSFGPLPWVLAARGYVVLAYDKRGTGASTGSWEKVGIEPLGSDLAAAIEYVARLPRVYARHIGVIGTSEGAWVAANATRYTSRIRAIVALSGGAQTKGEAYVHKMKSLALESGLKGAGLDSAVAAAALTIREANNRVMRDSATTSGFDRRVTYDPTPDWRRYRGAFLYMGGEADVLEPAATSARWFSDLFASASHPDYTVKLLPLGHHSLVRAVKGTPSEFASLSELREMVPGYWSILLKWLDDRLRPR